MSNFKRNFAQVKTACGGGTRKIQVKKTASKEDLIKLGIELFFPDGQSSKGKLTNFNIDLADFKRDIIPKEVTIEELFQKSKLSRLRVYLYTKEKCSTINSTETTSQTFTLEDSNSSEDLYKGLIIDNLNTITSTETTPQTFTPEDGSSSKDLYKDLTSDNLSTDIYFSQDDIILVTDEFSVTQHGTVDPIQTYMVNEIPNNSALLQNKITNSEPSAEDQFQFTSEDVFVHRGQVFKELTEAFIHRNLNKKRFKMRMILPNGSEEMGEDIGGVFRETLSEYWSSFFERFTVGTNNKVPLIRHDMNSKKWKAVAEVLYNGWILEKYFPLQLAKCFLEMCILEEVRSDLTECYLNFISNNEKEVIERALNNFEDVDKDELLEVMENIECNIAHWRRQSNRKSKNNIWLLKKIFKRIFTRDVVKAVSFNDTTGFGKTPQAQISSFSLKIPEYESYPKLRS
ncbi:unnamed protein product [Brassicogethes aeneus]|uniref:HECT domain-containing protein n=1 Tax=Brassicogethes aeneus TaxID=1431903 RepID=A0A9P0BHY3_BRAAE|nr:unnamed protein product [Brassicogethes aeneus]